MTGAQVAPRRARRDLERSEVVAAAREVIEKRGLGALSLRGLAARLGVSAPALYTHVDDKQDLLRAVSEAEFARMLDRFEAIDDVDPIDRIRARSRAYLDYARENPELFRAMFQFQPAFAAEHPGLAIPLATRAFEVGVAGIREAMASGRLRRGDPIVASLTLWTAVHGVATVLLAGARFGREREDALIESVIETVLSGLARERP